MRELYIILSVTGWAWCAAAGIFLWTRLRPRAGRRGTDAPGGPAEGGGGEEVSA